MIPEKIAPFKTLTQGVQLTKQNFLAFLPLLVIALAGIFLVNSVLMDVLLQQNPDATMIDLLTKTSAVLGLIIAPVEVGIMLMGLSAARGEKIKFSDIKYILPYSPKIIILAIITMFLVQLGLLLFVIPGLFLMVVLSMAPMIMCDQKLGMTESLKISAQTLSKHWFSLFIVYIWLIIAIILSFYTMGIALILTLPLYVNVKGLMYRQLFDKKESTVAPATGDGFEA